MFSVSVTSLIYSSGNHRMWTSPVPPVLETLRIRAMRISWKLRLHIETLFHLYSVLWHSNSNKGSYLPLLSWQQKAKVEKKKKCQGIIIKISPFTTKYKPEVIHGWSTIFTAKLFPNCPSSLVLLFIGGRVGEGVEGDLLSILQCSWIIFLFAHIKSPE